MDGSVVDGEERLLRAWRRAKGTGRDVAALEILRSCAGPLSPEITARIAVVDLISPLALTEPSRGEMFSPRWDLISSTD